MSQAHRHVRGSKNAAVEGEPNSEVRGKPLIPGPQLLCGPFVKLMNRIRQGEAVNALGPPVCEQGREILQRLMQFASIGLAGEVPKRLFLRLSEACVHRYSACGLTSGL